VFLLNANSYEGSFSKGKRACAICNGCPENRIDVARAEQHLLENGWTIVKNWQEANLILFNACGRGTETTSFSLNLIKEIQSGVKENQQLVVWGCLPKIDPVTLEKAYTGSVSAGSELVGLDQIIGSKGSMDKTTANYLGIILLPNKKDAPTFIKYEGSFLTRALKRLVNIWENFLETRFNLTDKNDGSVFYIKVSTGCNSYCSYCAIRKSRGITKSKPIEDVLKQFREGLQKGFKYFSLMGTDLGSYGSDLNCSLTDLLKALVKEDGVFKINLRNINPYYLVNHLDEFIGILKTGRIRYIETAAESGSNRIVRLMNRHYTIEEFKNCINRIRKEYPQIIMRTQLIVGFPTETDSDFSATMKLLDDVVFDFVEVYQYSDRPGTISDKMEPKVPDRIKRQRYIKLYIKALLNRTPRKIRKLLLNET
jgi:threonylcarbamoyladenosine tRNA methylthiotransferase MtaB